MTKKTIFFIRNNEYLILIFIIIFNFFTDKFYHANTFYLPAWDQGYHLSNLFSTYNSLENFNVNSIEWWNNFWTITDSYRGPLTYIFSSFFLFIFGKNYENSLLSNNIFSIISILCIFGICKEIGNVKGGLWGAFIFAFNPYIFDQRVDYLIDISQVCFINLNFYILLKFFKSKGGLFLSFLLGITLGFVFLTKPTGILFLILPYSYTFLYLIKKVHFIKNLIIYILILITSFLIIIWPWFSINWITIFTSILNSWQWGIKYQEGMEANTLEGIIFYPKIIFRLIGPYVLGSFLVISSIDFLKKLATNRVFIRELYRLLNKNIFLFLLPINILIICTLMSTKDLRFILPIFPSLCAFSGIYISSLKKYYWISYYKMFIFLIILLTLIFHLNYKINISQDFDKKLGIYWPHQEIIKTVNSVSPNLNSVIAFLPDTAELNTFNLAAEAKLQNNNISISQIISNEKSFKDDLNRFNWFLLKSGDQGIMTNDTKINLSKLIQESNLFENFKSWYLPDNSKAKLYKRRRINESIKIINENLPTPKAELFLSNNGLTIYLKGNQRILNNSNLLISAHNKNENYEINIALPQIINLSKENIEIIKNLNYEKSPKLDESFDFKCTLISERNEIYPIFINEVVFKKNIKNLSEEKFEINKIQELENMGNFLKNGDFDNLFNLVGLVNQSDPSQEYLKDAEKIFKFRYQLNKANPDYLYNVAISQILQRKSNEASFTLKKFIDIDKSNSNLYLAKAVVDIYNFNPREAEKNINLAIKLNRNENLYSTINTMKLISNIINFRIRSFIKM